MDTPNVVVVGYGYAGRCFHTYLVRQTPSLHLYGIVTSRATAREHIQQHLRLKTFDHFEDVLADPQVDLVVLATPNDLHAPQAIQALAAGKHVVTDKPMCLNVAEAEAMIAASRQHQRLLSVFQNRRWDGDFLTVRQVLEAGLLGTPFLLQTVWLRHGQPRGWSGARQRGGGVLLDLGSHLIDQAVQLLGGPVDQVYARCHTNLWANDVDDHVHCMLHFASGVDVHITVSSVAQRSMRRWHVLGTRGALLKEGFDAQERAMVAGDIDAAREDPAHYARVFCTATEQPAERVIETVPGRWRSYYENIAGVLHNQEVLAVTPESSRTVMAILDAAKQSAATQQVVRLAAG
ncbi:MAG: Gfo/Idh/MocA family oxidoreductase [Candidatus Tectomicrobia bacterium]